MPIWLRHRSSTWPNIVALSWSTSRFYWAACFNALGAGAPDLSKLPAAKARLNGLDMLRWAEHWQVPLEVPGGHPRRTVTALRAALASDDLPRATHALFRAYWVAGDDVADGDVVARVLDQAGFDGKSLVQAAADLNIKTELRARTDEAIERGVFGAPAFFVGEQMWWGQDRLSFVAKALGGDDSAVKAAPMPTQRGSAALEFWFDFSSPFAYLASTQVEGVARRTSCALHYRPFLLGALFRSIGTADVPLQTFSQAKQRYLGSDMQRFADAYAVPFRFPSTFPIRSVLPLRAVLAAEQDGAKLTPALFRAAWADDRNIAEPKVVAEICSECGLDPALVERASEPQIKQQLRS